MNRTQPSPFPASRVCALAFAAAAAVAAPHAAAQSTPWTVKAGIVHITPNVTSGDLSAPSLVGTKIDVKAATTLMLAVDYAFTDHLGIELVLGWPPRHEIVGAGAISGSGTLGSVVQLPLMVLGQYRFFDAGSALRPYVGLGPTYVTFTGGRGTAALTGITNPGGPQTTPSVDSAFGASVQLGASYALTPQWSIDANVIKTFIKTKNHLSTGQTIDTKLDPLSVAIGVGYRF